MEEGHGSVGVDRRQPGKEEGGGGGGDGDPFVDKIQLENGEHPTVASVCLRASVRKKYFNPNEYSLYLTDIIMGQSQRISGHRLGDLSTEHSSIPFDFCEVVRASTRALARTRVLLW